MTRSGRLQCPAGRAPGVVPGALHPFLAQSSISRDHWSRLLPALPSVKTAELYCDPVNATLTGLVSNLCGAWIFAWRVGDWRAGCFLILLTVELLGAAA